jgi:hypothetical protein
MSLNLIGTPGTVFSWIKACSIFSKDGPCQSYPLNYDNITMQFFLLEVVPMHDLAALLRLTKTYYLLRRRRHVRRQLQDILDLYKQDSHFSGPLP